MHLFEAPNRFGLPAFYTLHVWAWKENPTGMFVNWHSNVSCDAFAGGTTDPESRVPSPEPRAPIRSCYLDSDCSASIGSMRRIGSAANSADVRPAPNSTAETSDRGPTAAGST